jgi:hypothetical protein
VFKSRVSTCLSLVVGWFRRTCWMERARSSSCGSLGTGVDVESELCEYDLNEVVNRQYTTVLPYDVPASHPCHQLHPSFVRHANAAAAWHGGCRVTSIDIESHHQQGCGTKYKWTRRMCTTPEYMLQEAGSSALTGILRRQSLK